METLVGGIALCLQRRPSSLSVVKGKRKWNVKPRRGCAAALRYQSLGEVDRCLQRLPPPLVKGKRKWKVKGNTGGGDRAPFAEAAVLSIGSQRKTEMECEATEGLRCRFAVSIPRGGRPLLAAASASPCQRKTEMESQGKHWWGGSRSVRGGGRPLYR